MNSYYLVCPVCPAWMPFCLSPYWIVLALVVAWWASLGCDGRWCAAECPCRSSLAATQLLARLALAPEFSSPICLFPGVRAFEPVQWPFFRTRSSLLHWSPRPKTGLWYSVWWLHVMKSTLVKCSWDFSSSWASRPASISVAFLAWIIFSSLSLSRSISSRSSFRTLSAARTCLRSCCAASIRIFSLSFSIFSHWAFSFSYRSRSFSSSMTALSSSMRCFSWVACALATSCLAKSNCMLASCSLVSSCWLLQKTGFQQESEFYIFGYFSPESLVVNVRHKRVLVTNFGFFAFRKNMHVWPAAGLKKKVLAQITCSVSVEVRLCIVPFRPVFPSLRSRTCCECSRPGLALFCSCPDRPEFCPGAHEVDQFLILTGHCRLSI